jgi:2-succinyl-5-enolpyruvyl-6-hydroxy-3-cyclohexene-1-carboxylate synthase
VLGDLAFFYDMNALGNRHMSSNIRIALINNGCGVEFNNSTHIASRYKSGPNKFMAAGGHFNSGEDGSERILPVAERMKTSLAKAWCEANGFEYAAATSKDEFLALRDKLLSPEFTRPIVVESFTAVADESRALEMITSVDPTTYDRAVIAAKRVLSPKLKAQARKALKKIAK